MMKINEKNLCVFATQPPYDKEGFLYKRGEVNKAFQKRYFVLKGNLLFYFEKKGDKEPLGLIIVEGCTIELSEENSDQYWFEIAFNGNRTYILSAESQESMESWMKALTCAGYEYKKLMVDELQRQLEEIEGSRNKISTESSNSTYGSLTPKPPPRRTNPFNRPAPPVPNSTNGNIVMDTNMTFINGHFGSSSQRNAHLGCNTSPIAPPRGIPATLQPNTSGPSSTKSEFYVSSQTTGPSTRKPQQHQSQHNRNTNTNITSCAVFKPALIDIPSEKSLNFDEIHEQFRHLVMKDVLAYQTQREIKRRPLIEL
ncbi:inositol phosphatase interacting protein [Haematobia irritans]|uniref:inositol phosphatase interacting protein n=1 Tax=Haematobia irritans TaxID=7368 RepID=UPI003F4FE4C3